MDLNLKLTSNRFIKFDGNNKEGSDKTPTNGDSPTPTAAHAPEIKPVTASIQDVLASYAQGTIKFVSTTGNQSLPPIQEGVTEFEYEGSEITTFNNNGKLNIQVRGNIDPSIIRKKLPELIPVEPILIPVEPSADGANGINGEIDENVKQGNTGDCWVLTGVLALNSTDVGKQIIKNSIQANPDGSVTITFKGLGVSYTISAEEIAKHDTDNNTRDAYSNGDNDMLVLELATKKLMADIASGKVKLNVPADSVESIYNEDGSIEGGFAQNMIYYLTGQTADFIYAYGKEVQGLPQDEVLTFLAEAYKNGNNAMTFGVYGAPHHATLIDGTPYKLDIEGGHALAITNITATTVTFVNPWNSNKEYTMTWEEFAKLGIGMLTATDLSGIEEPAPIDPPVVPDPVTPTPDGKIYTRSDLMGVPQSLIDKFFEPYGFEADGTPEEWVLKSEYKDIKITQAQGLEFADGSTIIRDLCITTTSLDENGNEIKTRMQYFSREHLNSYLGHGSWQSKQPWWYKHIDEYFEVDKESGLFLLKQGKSLETLKSLEPKFEKETPKDPTDPKNWCISAREVEPGLMQTFFDRGLVEKYLSSGIIDRFLEPVFGTNRKGEEVLCGYELKEPYTGFKLVSNSETERVYEFSYTKDGVKYISTVTIDETDGSYRIKISTEQIATPSTDKTKEEIFASMLGKLNKK